MAEREEKQKEIAQDNIKVGGQAGGRAGLGRACCCALPPLPGRQPRAPRPAPPPLWRRRAAR